jgi:hypothetical protein
MGCRVGSANTGRCIGATVRQCVAASFSSQSGTPACVGSNSAGPAAAGTDSRGMAPAMNATAGSSLHQPPSAPVPTVMTLVRWRHNDPLHTGDAAVGVRRGR